MNKITFDRTKKTPCSYLHNCCSLIVNYYPRPLTCDGCKTGIRLSIAQLLSEEFINGIIEEVSGDEGCGQEKEPEKCRAVVAELIPLALPAIASSYDQNKDAPEICNKAVKGICQP